MDEDVPENESEDETPNAADPKANERIKERKRFKENNYTMFWRRVLADSVGREVMFTFLVDCGTFEYTAAITPSGMPDASKTWFLLGKKSIGEALRDRLELADRVGFAAMYDEWHPRFRKPVVQKRRTKGAE